VHQIDDEKREKLGKGYVHKSPNKSNLRKVRET
jgi:hypothetical protein